MIKGYTVSLVKEFIDIFQILLSSCDNHPSECVFFYHWLVKCISQYLNEKSMENNLILCFRQVLKKEESMKVTVSRFTRNEHFS